MALINHNNISGHNDNSQAWNHHVDSCLNRTIFNNFKKKKKGKIINKTTTIIMLLLLALLLPLPQPLPLSMPLPPPSAGIKQPL